MNNNGVFLNMENVPDEVIKKIEEIISINENRAQEDAHLSKQEKTDFTAPPLNQGTHKKAGPLSTMYDECQRTVEESISDDDFKKTDIRQIWNNFEKEKHNSKKSSVNTFLNAKKKYSRQVITESKICPPFLEKE